MVPTGLHINCKADGKLIQNAAQRTDAFTVWTPHQNHPARFWKRNRWIDYRSFRIFQSSTVLFTEPHCIYSYNTAFHYGRRWYQSWISGERIERGSPVTFCSICWNRLAANNLRPGLRFIHKLGAVAYAGCSFFQCKADIKLKHWICGWLMLMVFVHMRNYISVFMM